MARVAIFTDSASDLDPAEAAASGLHIVPLIVMAIVFIPLGAWVFGRAEAYAKRTGKLKRVG